MRDKAQRWPAIIVTEADGSAELHCKMDFNPKTGRPHGVMMWRTGGTGKGHDLDQTFDKISRVLSRAMQGRAP